MATKIKNYHKDIFILGIESSCDDTAAAVVKDGELISNIVSNQEIHKHYGGVVPEIASREHQKNIVPVVDMALKKAKIGKDKLSAVAFTQGPGLLGSLLVGTSFAKAFAQALNIPLISVNHLHAHLLSPFIKDNKKKSFPPFPYLTLLVSGGHTQIYWVKKELEFELIGTTLDDAAGEAFDKVAKILGIDYPGGPMIDKLSKTSNKNAFKFSKAKIKGLDFSFSGLKTSVLYFLKKQIKKDPDFINKNLNDLCASVQKTIIEVLTEKIILASNKTNCKNIAVVGGVAANSEFRNNLRSLSKQYNIKFFIPDPKFCTDNAAMIATVGYYKYLNNNFADIGITAQARLKY